MSTVVYSYSTGQFSYSTLLTFNGQTGQLEPSPFNVDYRNPNGSSIYRNPRRGSGHSVYRNPSTSHHNSSSSLKKWGTLNDLSTLDLSSITEDNSDSGLGSSSDYTDTESRASPVNHSADFSSGNNSDSDSSDEIESPNTAVHWPSSTSFLARFRPEYLRDYQLVPEIDNDFLNDFTFFELTRNHESPKEWSEEEQMEFIEIQMRKQWNVSA